MSREHDDEHRASRPTPARGTAVLSRSREADAVRLLDDVALSDAEAGYVEAAHRPT